MKPLLTILISTFCQTIFGQFGIVADKNGFANVRNSPDISDNIIDTLTNGQIVFCFEGEGEWLSIDYDFDRQYQSGYIHHSRVKFIHHFEQLFYQSLNDTLVTFNKDSISLVITKRKFDPKINTLEYHYGDGSEDETSWLEKINGKEIWGTDGTVPTTEYGQITLTIGNEEIHLPKDNLFEPNLELTTVHVDKKTKTLSIIAMNSDGVGGYAVLWIIENGKFKQQIITIPF